MRHSPPSQAKSLAWLRARGGRDGPSGVRGYHRLGDLIRDLLTIGADPDAVRTECRYLARAGCVLPEHLRPDSIQDQDLIRITPSGHVHLELAHRDVNYLAACSEDCWVTDFDLADSIRQRITQRPYWRGLSWPNTLAKAAGLAAHLKSVQEDSIHAAPYLPTGESKADTVDFDRMLSEIANHRLRVAGHRGSPPDLSHLHDHFP